VKEVLAASTDETHALGGICNAALHLGSSTTFCVETPAIR